MSAFDEGNQAFVVRLWREPREIDSAEPTWRGVVEHVPTADRRFIKELDEIPEFISMYVSDMVPGRGWRHRLRIWLRFWKRKIRAA